ncbi:phosphate ABC transporter ATP-binding protein, partial [Rhodobacter sp. M37P]|nr:phosphate ABC transporter ATP-binding protein [Rhodobacter calidifons]
MNDMTRTGLQTDTATAKISARGVQVHYGTTHALKDV